MPIKTSCTCGFTFNAKDQLAGKKVKCPRCTKALEIPSGEQAVAAAVVKPAQQKGRAVNKNLLDLLDDEGVHGIPQGPICQSCGNVMSATSVICVNCGFNTATGEFLETEIEGDDGVESVGITNAERIMAKAEEEIDENPISGEDQDFGDGADSYVIALAAVAIAGVLLLSGLAVVLVMEYMTSDINPAIIGVIVGCLAFTFCNMWIVVMAFIDDFTQGLLCFFFLPYAVYYGFTKGSAWLLWPTIILCVSFPMAVAGQVYLQMTMAA